MVLNERHVLQAEDIIAPCFNTVPLRIQLTAGSTNMSVKDSLQHLNADVLPYQLTPLRRIMTTLKTEGQRLFDTLFILQHAPNMHVCNSLVLTLGRCIPAVASAS